MTTKTTTMSATRTKTKTSRLLGSTVLGAALVLGVCATGGVVLPARAATIWGAGLPTKAPELRTVEGTVSDKDGAPIQGAVVYLQDTKSMAVKSFLSDKEGHFHFRHLSMDTDFGLWAEMNGSRSKTVNISQFNSHPELDYTLKLDVNK